MKFINEFMNGDAINGIYLCKQKTMGVAKNGKEYISLELQDKTGKIDAKIWDIIASVKTPFDQLDFVKVTGRVSTYADSLQFTVDTISKANSYEYEASNYFPCTEKNTDMMYAEIIALTNKVKNGYYRNILSKIYMEDDQIIEKILVHSAAKSVHHGFIGGFLEHTLSVAKICDFFCNHYDILNRDLLLTAALIHDIGKIYELSSFPANDYTDEGMLLGHIVIGCEKITEIASQIPDFPVNALNELKHCILAHHGELEYGSPKKPALIEAVALHYADILDARMETFIEVLKGTDENNINWLGYNRFLDSNIRRTIL